MTAGCIDTLRMEEVQKLKLLKTIELALKDRKEVGYADSTNISRKTKKLEGITPIRYRRLANIDSV